MYELFYVSPTSICPLFEIYEKIEDIRRNMWFLSVIDKIMNNPNKTGN